MWPDILRVRLLGVTLLGSELRVTRVHPPVRDAEVDVAGDFVRLEVEVTEDGVVDLGGCCVPGRSCVRLHVEGRPRLPNAGLDACNNKSIDHN